MHLTDIGQTAMKKLIKKNDAEMQNMVLRYAKMSLRDARTTLRCKTLLRHAKVTVRCNLVHPFPSPRERKHLTKNFVLACGEQYH